MEGKGRDTTKQVRPELMEHVYMAHLTPPLPHPPLVWHV